LHLRAFALGVYLIGNGCALWVIRKTYIKRELGYIQVVSDIRHKLKDYHNENSMMSPEERLEEKHKSSRLGIHMRAGGVPRPHPRWEAHAIVSGAHEEGDVLRAIFALAGIRIDDPDNGCWLPKSEADKLGSKYPDAVVHGRIHRWHYYRWLEDQLEFDIPGTAVRNKLKHDVRHQLLTSTFPSYVMKKKGE